LVHQQVKMKEHETHKPDRAYCFVCFPEWKSFMKELNFEDIKHISWQKTKHLTTSQRELPKMFRSVEEETGKMRQRQGSYFRGYKGTCVVFSWVSVVCFLNSNLTFKQ
jgi:hypothetical protein